MITQTKAPCQLTQAFQLVAGAIFDSIKEAGPSGIPSGHLYAMIQSCLPSVPLDFYQATIDALIQTGKIKRDASHRLTVA